MTSSLQPCDDDLARARFGGAVDGEQIAVEDAGVAHAQAAYFQQVIGARLEQMRIDLEMRP